MVRLESSCIRVDYVDYQDVRANDAIAIDLDARTDQRVRTHFDIGSQVRRRVDDGGGMDQNSEIPRRAHDLGGGDRLLVDAGLA